MAVKKDNASRWKNDTKAVSVEQRSQNYARFDLKSEKAGSSISAYANTA
jgi:hypothetical protein